MKTCLKNRIALTIMILLIMAWGAQLAPARADSEFPLRITDQFGREIRLSKEPLRIVSGSPANTEILYALGLGERVVGVTSFCDYPPEALQVEKIGDLAPLNIEKVLSLRPDLVVGDVLNSKDSVLGLEELGVPVLALNPNSFQQSLEAILLVGKATGKGLEAEKLVQDLAGILAVVEEKGNRIKDRGLKALIVVGMELSNQPLWTAGPGSFLHEAVILAGGQNIAEDIGRAWAQMSIESILKRDPDLIITEMDPSCFYLDKIWGKVSAVQKRQVYQIDVNLFSRPGPRMGQALEDLALLIEKSR